MNTTLREFTELWRELWVERSRLLLVVLGLVWGTVGLSLLTAFGSGMHDSMADILKTSGDAMLRLYAGSTTRPFAGLPAGRRIALLPEDAARAKSVSGVVAVSVEHQQGGRLLGSTGVPRNATVLGVDPDYADVRGMRIAEHSRFLQQADQEERRRVVVLGDKLAQALLGNAEPVGASITLWDTPFLVIGVLAERVTMMNYGGEDAWKAIVPAATLRAMRGVREVQYLLVRCADPRSSVEVTAGVRRALSVRRSFDPEDAAAIGCSDHADMAQQIHGILTGTQVFMFVVGLLGLLVAAIGVANMMFVTVEERVHEIGVRLAVGASPRQIRRRHLLEAACVVAVGGGLGLCGSALLLYLINLLPMPSEAKTYLGEPLLRIGHALAIAGLLGVCAALAGWHPAARAAAVQPVEALRHE